MANFELSHKGLEFLHIRRWEKHTRQKGHCVKRQRYERNIHIVFKEECSWICLNFGLLGEHQERWQLTGMQDLSCRHGLWKSEAKLSSSPKWE